MHHHAQLIFVIFFLVEMRFHHVGQPGLKPLTSGDLHALASQSARITGMNHHAWPFYQLFFSFKWNDEKDTGLGTCVWILVQPVLFTDCTT